MIYMMAAFPLPRHDDAAQPFGEVAGVGAPALV
jgi:hypothetical protein